MELYEKILDFWFGRIETTIIPSEHRAKIWFSNDPEVDELIQIEFKEVLDKAIEGEYNHWRETPRGQLALIIVLDQFSRHIYRDQPECYCQDELALDICEQGLLMEADHHLSLVERLFFYFPLLHSEQLLDQNKALSEYQLLSELALEETQVVYNSFVKFANHHYILIDRFGRFPQRNSILDRLSTDEELDYLQHLDD